MKKLILTAIAACSFGIILTLFIQDYLITKARITNIEQFLRQTQIQNRQGASLVATVPAKE